MTEYELSVISDKLDINVWELINLANHHPRVNILQPGPGVGGHCIAVDPWFIVSETPEEARLIRTSRLVNDSKPDYVIDLVAKAAKKYDKPVIACFGLAFKADIDDLRGSPALAISQILADKDIGEIIIVEPNVASLPEGFSNMKHVSLRSTQEAIESADVLVGLVDHREFKQVKLNETSNKTIIDTRGMWQHD